VEQRNAFFEPDGLDWARLQLKEAGYEQSTAAHLVRKVHEALAPYVHQDIEHTLPAMPVIAQLLQGKPLTEELWEPEKRAARTYTWVPVMARGVYPGHTVRVKQDAYGPQNPLASHNGRKGTVSALRGGVIVVYEGASGASMGTRHPPDKLEVQVPIQRRVT